MRKYTENKGEPRKIMGEGENLKTPGTDSGNIILIGMPTSGKSTVGVILAKILGKYFSRSTAKG